MAGTKGHSGRKRLYKIGDDAPPSASVRDVLELSAPEAARYVRACVNGQERKPHYARLDLAKYVIDHHLGKATTKVSAPVDANGNAIIPYTQIIVMANREQKRLQETGAVDDFIDAEMVEISPEISDIDKN